MTGVPGPAGVTHLAAFAAVLRVCMRFSAWANCRSVTAMNLPPFVAQNRDPAGQLLRNLSAAAVTAHYDRRTSRIIVRLNTGLELAFPPALAEGVNFGNY